MSDFVIEEQKLSLVGEMESAVLPWRSTDAISPETYSHLKTARISINKQWVTDPQEQIDKCLSCCKLTCTDCITNERRNQLYAKRKITIKRTTIEVEM